MVSARAEIEILRFCLKKHQLFVYVQHVINCVKSLLGFVSYILINEKSKSKSFRFIPYCRLWF